MNVSYEGEPESDEEEVSEPKSLQSYVYQCNRPVVSVPKVSLKTPI